jgi:hypothetical protein
MGFLSRTLKVLIKAIQEQQPVLERKDEEIHALNARLTVLERMVEELVRQQEEGRQDK